MFSEGSFIPDYASIDPDNLIYKDTLISTQRRIFQAADFISDQPRAVSETKASQQKVLDNFADSKDQENKAQKPKKEKSIISLDSVGDKNFRANHFVPDVTTTESFRRVMQGSDLLHREMTKSSVTTSDYVPKILYPFSVTSKPLNQSAQRNADTKSFGILKSKFPNMEDPSRYTFEKFMDD